MPRASRNRNRHGFVSRLTYGLLLPMLVLIVASYLWARHHGAGLAASQKWSVTVFGQQVLLHPAVAVQAMLILPAAFGMCLRLILLGRRTNRTKLFRNGLIATVLATALGMLMFRLLADVLKDLIR